MKLLAIDAASGRASVALIQDDRHSQFCSEEPRAHADALLSLVTQALAAHALTLADLDGLAFGRGPGGFTGLRVAAAIVQGLAYGAGKPVAAISTLAALAQPLIGSGEVLVCTDARKEQVYCGHFAADAAGLARIQGEEQVLDPAAVAVQESTVIGTGDGFDSYPVLRATVNQYVPGALSNALQVAQLAVAGWADFNAAFTATPVYVRNKVTHGS